MSDPIIVDTETLAAALEVDVRTIQRLTRAGVLTPVGKAPRRGRGGRPPMTFDLRASIAAVRHAATGP